MNNRIVAEVVELLDSKRIVINKGSDDGIDKSFRCIIYNVGKEIIDPSSNKSLGKLEVLCGEAVAEHIQPKMTTLISSKKVLVSSSKRVKRIGGMNYLFGDTEEITDPVYETKDFDGVKIGSLVRQIS